MLIKKFSSSVTKRNKFLSCVGEIVDCVCFGLENLNSIEFVSSIKSDNAQLTIEIEWALLIRSIWTWRHCFHCDSFRLSLSPAILQSKLAANGQEKKECEKRPRVECEPPFAIDWCFGIDCSGHSDETHKMQIESISKVNCRYFWKKFKETKAQSQKTFSHQNRFGTRATSRHESASCDFATKFVCPNIS